MDNPPLDTLEDLATRSERNLAIGVDARSRGFSADSVLSSLVRLRQDPKLGPSLVFATASNDSCYAVTRKPGAATRSPNPARSRRVSRWSANSPNRSPARPAC